LQPKADGDRISAIVPHFDFLAVINSGGDQLSCFRAHFVTLHFELKEWTPALSRAFGPFRLRSATAEVGTATTMIERTEWCLKQLASILVLF
jgi:hypothetical protein